MENAFSNLRGWDLALVVDGSLGLVEWLSFSRGITKYLQTAARRLVVGFGWLLRREEGLWEGDSGRLETATTGMLADDAAGVAVFDPFVC